MFLLFIAFGLGLNLSRSLRLLWLVAVGGRCPLWEGVAHLLTTLWYKPEILYSSKKPMIAAASLVVMLLCSAKIKLAYAFIIDRQWVVKVALWVSSCGLGKALRGKFLCHSLTIFCKRVFYKALATTRKGKGDLSASRIVFCLFYPLAKLIVFSFTPYSILMDSKSQFALLKAGLI